MSDTSNSIIDKLNRLHVQTSGAVNTIYDATTYIMALEELVNQLVHRTETGEIYNAYVSHYDLRQAAPMLDSIVTKTLQQKQQEQKAKEQDE